MATLPGLDASIQKALNINTFIANPFANMEVSSGINKEILVDDAPGLMMACGLALRTFDNE